MEKNVLELAEETFRMTYDQKKNDSLLLQTVNTPKSVEYSL